MNNEVLIQYILDNVTPDFKHWDLPVFKIDGEEIAIAENDEQAKEACAEYIAETVWAFNASFIAQHSNLSEDIIKAIQGDRCEDTNEDLKSIIEDWDHFVDDAIACDGIGHFLSHYDGEEIEIGEFRLYRI